MAAFAWAVVLSTLFPGAAALAVDVTLVPFGPALDAPTYLTAAPGDDDRLFVTRIDGEIEILDADTGAQNGVPFLTVPGVGGEGLQGLAFHPDYQANGRFYVWYYGTDDDSHLVEYTRSTPDLADAGSADTILLLPQPFSDHNGGWIGFGPDGYLYVPTGDGGGVNDPNDNGQPITGELLGNVLRIDVDGDDFPGDPDRDYAIPPDNPFAGAIPGEDEIWAYGLRNPFRASFDRATGDLWIADVGQNAHEEIDFQPAASPGGENYGWSLREGFDPTPGVGGPKPPGNVDPIYAYDHGTGPSQGNSITGGAVYRGPIGFLRGQYFFGDFENDRIWSVRYDGAQLTDFTDWTDQLDPTSSILGIVAFGEDNRGNLYTVDFFSGDIHKLVGPGVPALPHLWMHALLAAGLVAASARPRGRRRRL